MMLAAALHYAERGWRPIPLTGKIPQLANWPARATTKQTTVRSLWQRWPTADIGIVTGGGLLVLDVDPRHGGDASLAELERVHGPLPDTPRGLTGGGGLHVYLAVGQPVGNCTNLAPGIDLRGDGGYVVAPPSLHASGRRYVWELGASPDDVPLALVPRWLLECLQERAPGRLRADGTPLVLREGERDHRLFQVAAALRRYGINSDGLRGCLEIVNREHATPPLDAGELATIAASAGRYTPARPDDLGPVVADAIAGDEPIADVRGPWTRAVPAADFLAGDDPTLDWLIPRVLAPGSLTNFFSPRGLGKTHVACAYAVELARRGHRVLLLDRDNSKREIRRRLRSWGAAELTTLEVMTRDDVPPLTDTAAWATFPLQRYALVIVDSLDASTEGVGEQDSAKPAKAIAPLLDIAHRADGPAILILGNTIKSGSHGRGSGVLEDRGDIVYEVRDATDFQPSGTKPWWTELPAAGREAWAERATRRQQRDRYVLAFVPSKFRVGIEPEPFALEIDLSTEPWQLREVTAALDQAAESARAQAAADKAKAEQALVERFMAEVDRRAEVGEQPLIRTEAVEVLHGYGTSREAARALLDREAGKRWRLVDDPAHSQRVFVVGVNQEWPPHSFAHAEPGTSHELFEGANRAGPAAQGPHGLPLQETLGAEGLAQTPQPCGDPHNSPGGGGNGVSSAADGRREPGEDDVEPEVPF
jgi:hypothetical protein